MKRPHPEPPHPEGASEDAAPRVPEAPRPFACAGGLLATPVAGEKSWSLCSSGTGGENLHRGALEQAVRTPLVVYVDYPLRKPAYFRVTGEESFTTAGAVFNLLEAVYAAIYAAEERAVGAEAHRARAGGKCANRGETDGPYGIWGHDLEDLHVHSLYYSPRAEAWYMEVDS